MKRLFFLLLTVLIAAAAMAKAQTVWSSAKGTVTFSKSGFADWTLTTNQDRISDSVWITRSSTQSLFNIRKENVYSSESPYGTKWAFGTTDSAVTLTYKSFSSLSGGNPQSLIGKNLVLQLVAEKIYLDMKFLTYGNGSTGGTFSYTRAVSGGVTSVKETSPVTFGLKQNFPNPFNPSTTIGFTVQVSGFTTLKIYDAVGREAATLVNEELEAGVYYQKQFTAGNLSSGVYYARLTSGTQTQMKKLLLMK